MYGVYIMSGLEFASGDQPQSTRFNQKTTFVGTGAQIDALTTYAGMHVYCTSSGGAFPFVIDTEYVRNTANSAWLEYKKQNNAVTETAEANTTPVTTNANFTPVAATRYYSHFTMPSVDPLYIIVGIEWKNGAAVGGNVTCGVDLINADPPTLDHTVLMAYGINTAQAGTSAVQRNSNISGQPIRAGTICGAWIAFSAATANGVARLTTSDSQKRNKATIAADNESPNAGNNTAFAAADANEVYIKIYYRSYY